MAGVVFLHPRGTGWMGTLWCGASSCLPFLVFTTFVWGIFCVILCFRNLFPIGGWSLGGGSASSAAEHAPCVACVMAPHQHSIDI